MRRAVLVIAALFVLTAAGPGFAQPIDDAPVAIVFILDCSASTHTADMPGGKRRLDVLRAELLSAIEKLEARHFVGLMACGHRAGFDRDGRVRPRRDAFSGILPSSDVELLVPVRPLGTKETEHTRRIAASLETVAPWGESPLYLALHRADRAFENLELPIGDRRQIVVLTDGVNNQSQGPDFTTARQVSELYQALPNREVRIDVIALKVDPTALSAAEQRRFDELKLIAEQNHGVLATVENPDTLRVRLHRVLGLELPEADVGDRTPVGPGVIRGIVRFRNRPVSGIKVTVRSIAKTVRTDADGRFEFKDVPNKQTVVEAEGAIQNVTRRAIIENIGPVAEGAKADDLIIELR